MSRLWDKGAPLDERVLRYTAGEDHRLDERLVAYDVRASVAHAEMLERQGLLASADLTSIRSGLEKLARGHAAGEWHIELADEDVHTALERRLTAAIGDAGGRVHLGRSRNDQVLAALRLYLKDAADLLAERSEALGAALDRLAGRQGEVELPGYTHMQQAMPSTVALWAGGFSAAIRDDAEGLIAAKRRLDLSPLGSAAGYGTPGLEIDRESTAAALGFAGVQAPVTTVQLSRGKAESGLLFELTLLLQDTGRLAADLLLFYSQEFSYVTLSEEFTTGSSIMPQKRNPDVLELARAAPATAHACLDECLMITGKLTSGYHRDLQRLKAPLFRAIDLADDTLVIMTALLDGVSFQPRRIRLDPGVHAAEQANRLVSDEGVPFREAYRRIARRLAGK